MTSVSWRFEISKNNDMGDVSFANDHINATKTEVVYCLENLIYFNILNLIKVPALSDWYKQYEGFHHLTLLSLGYFRPV